MTYTYKTMRYMRLFDDAAADAPAEGTPPAEEAKAEAKYTDEDLDRILGEKFQKWQRKQQKAVDEAARLAQMTEQERAEHETEEMRTELEQLRAEKARAEMTQTARGILEKEGVPATDSILAVLVGENAETTNAAVKAFATEYKKAVQAGVREALKGTPPKAGTAPATMTKADIAKISDPIARQEAIRKNISLYR